MSTKVKSDRLIVPVYINEKIVLDMLAIMEDGFSTVSQVSYSEQKESNSAQKVSGGASATLLSKLLKIKLSSELSHEGTSGENTNITTERVHTNVWCHLLCQPNTNLHTFHKSSLLMLPTESTNGIDHTVHVRDRNILQVAVEVCKAVSDLN